MFAKGWFIVVLASMSKAYLSEWCIQSIETFICIFAKMLSLLLYFFRWRVDC